VSGNHRQTQQGVELAVILIDVTAADAASFDPHQGVIGANMRQLELLHRKLFIADLNDCACLGHNGSPATLRLSEVERPPSLGNFRTFYLMRGSEDAIFLDGAVATPPHRSASTEDYKYNRGIGAATGGPIITCAMTVPQLPRVFTYLIATAFGGEANPPTTCSGTDTTMNS
jgi:hypothetical protein